MKKFTAFAAKWGFAIITAALIIVSLTGVGVGYALWFEDLKIDGPVTTGSWGPDCTRTQGYWYTHSACGNNPHRDDTWDIVGEDTPFFSAEYPSGQTWCGAMGMPVRGDMYWNLAQQYIAAKLNAYAGATVPRSVRAALNGAEAWFRTYSPGVRSGQPGYAEGAALKNVLDDYNNGLLGVAHCDDIDTDEAEEGDSQPAPAAANSAPTAADDSYTIAAGSTLSVDVADGVLANDGDPDGDPITAILDTIPQHGTLVLNTDGSFSYVPGESFAGQDSFTYHASDRQAASNVATVTIALSEPAEEPAPPTEEPNQAPVAAGDNYKLKNETVLEVAAGPGVLKNDSDPDGDAITAVLEIAPTHGTLTLNPDGSFTYIPEEGFSGEDSFTYYVTDGVDRSEAATVTIEVEIKK